MFDIKNEIKSTFADNKFLILFSATAFIISLILGYVYQASLHETFAPVVQEISNNLEQGVITFSFKDIFINNIVIVFEVFILGIIFCFSIIILLFNGFFLGYFIGAQDNLFYSLMLIIPHGIFELPSLILATSAGFVLFKFIYKSVKSYNNSSEGSFKNKMENAVDINFKYFKQAVVLLVISAILMMIAAFVEVYVTLDFAYWIFSIFGI